MENIKKNRKACIHFFQICPHLFVARWARALIITERHDFMAYKVPFRGAGVSSVLRRLEGGRTGQVDAIYVCVCIDGTWMSVTRYKDQYTFFVNLEKHVWTVCVYVCMQSFFFFIFFFMTHIFLSLSLSLSHV